VTVAKTKLAIEPEPAPQPLKEKPTETAKADRLRGAVGARDPTAVLPPPNGLSAAERAAGIASSAAPIVQRARMTGALQRVAGNVRTSDLMGGPDMSAPGAALPPAGGPGELERPRLQRLGGPPPVAAPLGGEAAALGPRGREMTGAEPTGQPAPAPELPLTEATMSTAAPSEQTMPSAPAVEPEKGEPEKGRTPEAGKPMPTAGEQAEPEMPVGKPEQETAKANGRVAEKAGVDGGSAEKRAAEKPGEEEPTEPEVEELGAVRPPAERAEPESPGTERPERDHAETPDVREAKEPEAGKAERHDETKAEGRREAVTAAPGGAEGEPASALQKEAGVSAAAEAAVVGGVEGAAAAKTPEGGGGPAPDTALASPEAEGGGDEEAAADELEGKLEAAAPAESTESDQVEPEPAAEAEPALEAEAEAEPAAEFEGREEPSDNETPTEEPAAPTVSPAPAVAEAEAAAVEPAGGPSEDLPESETAEAGVEDGAVEAEQAELSPAEKDAAVGAMADGGSEEPSGGGGEGGGAVPDRPPMETPEVGSLPPQAALARAGNAPPAQLAAALGGVKAAVGNEVGEQRRELTASPPTVERPVGRGAAQVDVAPAIGAEKVEKAKEGREKPTPAPLPVSDPVGPPLVATVAPPAIRSTPEGELTDQDAQRMQGAISAMPITDPVDTTAGPPPQLALEGNADPAKVGEQRANLRASVGRTTAAGRADAAAYMGEDDIYDDQPAQTLTGKVGAGASGGAGGAGGAVGPGGAGNADSEAASIIAQDQKGSEIQAAVVAARAEMAAKQQEHAASVSEEKAKSKEEIAGLEKASAEEQAALRQGAKADVQKKRGEWTSEQDAALKEADKQAEAEVTAGTKKVEDEKRTADDKAREEIRKGKEEANQERRKADDEARRKKRDAEEESSGVLGWLASKAKAFFNKVKAAISAVFEAARKLIKAAIKKAKELAAKAIEAARRVIVAAIKAVGDALIAIGDRLLRHFPALRGRFRRAIKATVDKAVAAVNKLADKLNKAIQKALDLLGAALDAALGLLEKGLLAAIDAVGAVVEGALKFANSIVQALAMFARLIADVASGPLQWLKNLGAGVVDGIRNHLWKAFKSAVQEWFTSKVQEVVGVGATVWNLLVKGGITVAQIARMAWEGIKAIIPTAVIQILVEKLVSMIVPAAGAVKVIIEGLQAAWGSISRILQAFSKFFEFLKSVKPGRAGPPFASAVAAAAVAVIDFIANWLLQKLAKGARKVGGKLKGIARRLKGKKWAKAARKKMKAAKPKPGVRKPARGKPMAKPKRKKPSAKRRDQKQRDKARKKQERLDRAVKAIKPKLARLLAKGVSNYRLTLQLRFWQVRYRLTALDVSGSGSGQTTVVARLNPESPVERALIARGEFLRKIIHDVARELQRDPAIRAEAQRQLREFEEDPQRPVRFGGVLSWVRSARQRRRLRSPGKRVIEKTLLPTRAGGVIAVSEARFEQKLRRRGRSRRPLEERSKFGRVVSGPGSYLEVAERLKKIAANRNMSEARLMNLLRSFARTGQVPRGPVTKVQQGQLAKIGHLIFGRESVRTVDNTVLAAMTAELIGAREMTIDEAFAGQRNEEFRGGAFPMSMKGAEPAAAELQAERTQLEGAVTQEEAMARRSEAAAELARREIALAARWLAWRLGAEGGEAVSDDNKLRKLVREEMFKFYRLHIRSGGSGEGAA
jgi:hypothetical protein